MKNKQNILEEMLNRVYTAPDLGQMIFEALNPIVMRAYLLIKKDNEQREVKEPAFFGDIQDKIAVESIIYKDLPQIIDIYSKLPLEYRNKEKLKTGQTHRQNLLENIEKLMERLIQIEHLQYKDLDQKAIVKTNVIDQKYDHYKLNNNAQLEQEIVKIPKEEFDLSLFKKPAFNYNDINTLDSENIKDNNKKIKIIEGQVEIKVKNKMKAFMEGTYNAFNKYKPEIYQAKYILKSITIKTSLTLLAFTCIAIPLSPIGYLAYDQYKQSQQKMLINEFTDAENYMKNENNPKLREINIKLLEDYAKTQKHIKISVDHKNDTAFIDLTTNREECVNVVSNAFWLSKSLTMNGEEVPIMKRDVAELYCELPENHFSTSYRLSDAAPKDPKRVKESIPSNSNLSDKSSKSNVKNKK